MINTVKMQDMRYINLFGRITGINTRYCFVYNEMIFFCVPRHLISKAIGRDSKNLKTISETLRKKIRVVPMPDNDSENAENVKEFVQIIVNPLTFRDLEVKDGEVILSAGSHSKAALIGRNKRRLTEMQKIIKDFFGKEFRIV